MTFFMKNNEQPKFERKRNLQLKAWKLYSSPKVLFNNIHKILKLALETGMSLMYNQASLELTNDV